MRQLRRALVAKNVIVGGGVGAGTVLNVLGLSRNTGSVLAVSRRLPWPAALPRHHHVGQSRLALSLFPDVEYSDPRARISAEELQRNINDFQVKAVERFRADDVDGLEADVVGISRHLKGLKLECDDGTTVFAEKVFFAAGVGPERTLERSAVTFHNHPHPKRAVFHEVTTALQSLNESPDHWRNKVVTVYGGGATAAWVVEVLMRHSLENLYWMAKDFRSANPGGRNSETLELTRRHRHEATILDLSYRGDLMAPPADQGLDLRSMTGEGIRRHTSDIVVCATGSDPMGPTGVQSVLGDLYRELTPAVGPRSGVYAQTPDGSLLVLSSALTHIPAVKALIEGNTFRVLNAENRVVAGMAVTTLSAEDAATAAVESRK